MIKFKASLLGIAVSIALVIMPALSPAIQSFGQEQQRGQQSQMQNLPEEQQGDDDVAPAPPSIGAASSPNILWSCSLHGTERVAWSCPAAKIWAAST